MEIFIDGVIYERQSFGGISRVFDEILPRICDLDESLKVNILISNTPMKSPPKHAQIETIIMPSIGKYINKWRVGNLYYPLVTKTIYRLRCGDTRKKVWHSTYYTHLPFWSGMQIVTVYDFVHEKFGHILKDPQRTIVRKRAAISNADHIICISKTTKNDLIDLYQVPIDKIRVIYNGYNPIFKKRNTEQISLNIPKPYILYIGSRSTYKGFSDLIKSFSQWPSSENVNLIIVGKHFSVDEEQHIADLNIQEKVLVFDNISDNQLCDLYNQALAFVYPSQYEGFGIPLLESMACGCPIVASSIPSTIEVAGEIPVYFESKDNLALIGAIDKALQEGRQSKRVKTGIKHVAKFSWEKTAEKTLQIYRSIL